MIHLVAIATLVCLASWIGLAVGAGNVGLQLQPLAAALGATITSRRAST